MDAKVKNDPLPDHDDKFWPKDSDNRTFETKQVSCIGGHKFIMTKRANEVKCECGVGYVLSPGMSLRGGHIYFDEAFVV